MTVEIWLAYAIAATVIIIIPGPTILLVVTQSLTHGRPATIPLVLGVMLGDSVAVCVSLLGLGALLTASAELFSIVKWIGAAYLIYLGISLWRMPANKIETAHDVAGKSSQKLFMHAFIVTTFNPKGIVFFIAFLPQFVNPAFEPVPQFVILAITFVVIGTLNAALYAVFSGQLKRLLERDNARHWFNRCGGSALMGAGVVTAMVQRG